VKILLTGCDGQIGTEIRQAIATQAFGKHELVATNRQQLDITNQEQVHTKIATLQPDIVINSAAYTAVDNAESQANKAFSINRDGPENIARSCAQNSVKLIHISTDYVFDGATQCAYAESDPINPINVYGQSKAEGESAVREFCPQHIILRTSWAYSLRGNNFLTTMAKLILEEKPLRVVDDQIGAPTAAADIADTILQIGEQIVRREDPFFGTVHYTGHGSTSWYGFAKRIGDYIFETTDRTVKLTPIPTKSYPTPATRPMNSTLNCDLIQQQFEIKTVNWQQRVDHTTKQFLEFRLAKAG
jgi:dTDP-4-dehydrorhamnose reductase